MCLELSTGYPPDRILPPQSNSFFKFAEEFSFAPLQQGAKAWAAAVAPVAISAPDPAPEEAAAGRPGADAGLVAVAATVVAADSAEG